MLFLIINETFIIIIVSFIWSIIGTPDSGFASANLYIVANVLNFQNTLAHRQYFSDHFSISSWPKTQVTVKTINLNQIHRLYLTVSHLEYICCRNSRALKQDSMSPLPRELIHFLITSPVKSAIPSRNSTG